MRRSNDRYIDIDGVSLKPGTSGSGPVCARERETDKDRDTDRDRDRDKQKREREGDSIYMYLSIYIYIQKSSTYIPTKSTFHFSTTIWSLLCCFLTHQHTTTLSVSVFLLHFFSDLLVVPLKSGDFSTWVFFFFVFVEFFRKTPFEIKKGLPYIVSRMSQMGKNGLIFFFFNV